MPEIDAGRFPAKRATGETVTVEADIFADGHDVLAAVLRYRQPAEGPTWTDVPMTPLLNDRWQGEFPVAKLGRYRFTVEGWVDHFETWSRQLAKRIEAGQDVTVELEVGARMIEQAGARVDGNTADAARLARLGQSLRSAKPAALDGQVTEARELMRRYPDRSASTVYERELEGVGEPVRARFSTWYELFPRSVGKLKDVERLLPDIAAMGFDVLYLPPIHPIGKTHRKGANNRAAEPGEPGSPWAIGSEEGGH